MKPTDDEWKQLRALACKCARFGNLLVSDLYWAKVRGVGGDAYKEIARDAYKRMNDELSGWVRGAMTNIKVQGYWRRSGRDVLAGRERVACFSADRALAIEADHKSHRGAIYERDGADGYVLACRFEPVEIRDDGKLVGRREPLRLRIDVESGRSKRDWYIRQALDSIWSNHWQPGVLTLRFDRRRRKVDALVSYRKPRVTHADGTIGASLGPIVVETGELWLRRDDERSGAVNFAHSINRMKQMKQHYEGLLHRLRRRYGRGKGRGQVYRRKVEEIGDFSTWARGRVHELSREIVRVCESWGASTLRVLGLGDGDLPWHQLAADLRYKCEDAGITIEEPDVKQDATARAEKAEIRKKTRKIQRAKRGLQAGRSLVKEALAKGVASQAG